MPTFCLHGCHRWTLYHASSKMYNLERPDEASHGTCLTKRGPQIYIKKFVNPLLRRVHCIRCVCCVISKPFDVVRAICYFNFYLTEPGERSTFLRKLHN